MNDLRKTGTGLLATYHSLITFGIYCEVNSKADCDLPHIKNLLPNLFGKLKSIPVEPAKKLTLLAPYLTPKIVQIAAKCALSENFLLSHLASRLACAAFAISILASRIIDLSIGLFAAFASLTLLRNSSRLERLTIRQLTALDGVEMGFIGLRGMINPHQFNLAWLMKWSEGVSSGIAPEPG